MDCSLPGSSVHVILQARILECVAIPFSRESSRPRTEPRSLSLQTNSLPSELPKTRLSYCKELCWYRYIAKAVTENTTFSSVTQSCPTTCDFMDGSTPGFPVHHQLQELTQTHVSELVMPSHPLLSPSPPAFNCPSIRVFSNESVIRIRWPKYWSFSFRSVLPMNIQDWFPLGWTGWISFQSKGLSRAFSNTTVQKHQFCSNQLSLYFNSHIHTWLLEKS